MIRRLVVLVALMAPLDAVADPKAEAQQHVDRASAAHKAGNYTAALDELNIAYTLDPNPDLLFAIGQIHVKLGHCTEAITFYERFLATHPDAGPADAATEAITVCKQQPAEPTSPPAAAIAAPLPEPPPPAPPEPPIDTHVEGSSPFYADLIGDAATVGGIALGIAAVLEYRDALHDLDLADSSATYDAHASLVSDANSKRLLTVLFGGGGLALVGVGVFQYVRHGRAQRDRGVAVVPTRGGGVMTWTSGF